jgi:hypothetical protein
MFGTKPDGVQDDPDAASSRGGLRVIGEYPFPVPAFGINDGPRFLILMNKRNEFWIGSEEISPRPVHRS